LTVPCPPFTPKFVVPFRKLNAHGLGPTVVVLEIAVVVVVGEPHTG